MWTCKLFLLRVFLFLFGTQAHDERDVGKERSVVQQPRLPVQPLHGHHCVGPGETVGQGTKTNSNTEEKYRRIM